MRKDTEAFAALNKSPHKEPHVVIEQAFDEANTDLHHFTSHADSALPVGASATTNVVESVSGTSQKLSPDKGTSSIGNIDFSLVDPTRAIRDLLGNKLAAAKSLRNKRTRVYMGYKDLAWDDYVLVSTQLVREIKHKDDTYSLACNDVQRQARKDIFDLFTTNLSQSIDATQLLIPVYSVTGIETNLHGTSYTDAPGQSVMYIRVEDEVVRCTGSTTDATLGLCFVADQRGALNTRASEHTVDPDASPDRRKKVEEYVYLELPAPKLVYALLTGEIYEPENLINRSAGLANSEWVKTNVTVDGNVAPDSEGEMLADLVKETTADAAHRITRSDISLTAETQYTLIVELKVGTRRYGRLRFGTDIGYLGQINFDIQDGVFSSSGSGVDDYKTEKISDGWYRLYLVVTTQVGTTRASLLGVYVWDTSTGGSSGGDGYLGDGSSGFYITRFQMVKGYDLNAIYYKTTDTPLVSNHATLPTSWHLVYRRTMSVRRTLSTSALTGTTRWTTPQGLLHASPATVRPTAKSLSRQNSIC